MSKIIEVTPDTTFREWYEAQEGDCDNVTAVNNMMINGIEYIEIADGQCTWYTTVSDWRAALATKISDTAADKDNDASIYGELCTLCSSAPDEIKNAFGGIEMA